MSTLAEKNKPFHSKNLQEGVEDVEKVQ